MPAKPEYNIHDKKNGNTRQQSPGYRSTRYKHILSDPQKSTKLDQKERGVGVEKTKEGEYNLGQF